MTRGSSGTSASFGLRTLAFLLALAPHPAHAEGLALAHGAEGLPIVVAGEASASERAAAAELADWLGRLTGARFPIVTETDDAGRAAILVGPTAAAAHAGWDCAAMRGEAWRYRVEPARLLLCGGRPRGTLYAVYHFLEDELGVRWWSPFEATLPEACGVVLEPRERQGEPVFVYRDVHGLDGPPIFAARSRINGHHSFLPDALGGREAYGLPQHVHDFYTYVPPAEWFPTHPELFAEVDGARVGARAQLCLSEEALLDLVTRRMLDYVERSREAARAAGERAPRLYDFSQNDWGGECACSRCRALAEREGTRAAPLLAFVDALAERVAEHEPSVLVDTLAYGWSFEPPRTLSAGEHVVLRVSALHQREFSRPLDAPVNAPVLRALAGWPRAVRHLRIWEYAVGYGNWGDLPLPNLPVLARDLRLYRDLGVEGVFLQQSYPIAGDLRDLKVWVLARLLEDPGRDLAALVAEFTEGFYGAAAPHLRAYLAELERTVARHPPALRHPPAPADYAWLDGAFLRAAQRRFDAAERAVAGDAVAARRVRHARLSLDRATLVRWTSLPLALRRELGVEPPALLARVGRTWREQIVLRVPPARRGSARRELDRELRALAWAAGGAPTLDDTPDR